MTLFEWKLNEDKEIVMYVTLGDITWLLIYPKDNWDMIYKKVIYDRNVYLVHLVRKDCKPAIELEKGVKE